MDELGKLLFVDDESKLDSVYHEHISLLRRRYPVEASALSQSVWDKILSEKYTVIIVGDILEPVDLEVAEIDFRKQGNLRGIDLAVLINETANPNRDTPLIYVGIQSPRARKAYLTEKGIPTMLYCSYSGTSPIDLLGMVEFARIFFPLI